MGLILCPFQAKFWLEMVLILAYIAPLWGLILCPFQAKFWLEMVLISAYIAPYGAHFMPISSQFGLRW